MSSLRKRGDPTRLSKSLYMVGLQCVKALHLTKFRPELAAPVPPEREAIFKAGTEVGTLARDLFPGGVEVPYGKRSLTGQVEKTRSLIASGVKTIYEATFSFDGVLAKVDILHRGDEGWEIHEVKMSTSVKDEHIDDLAVQYYVVKGSGLDVSRAFLVHVDNSYVKDGPIWVEKLFSSKELTAQVMDMHDFVREKVRSLQEMLRGTEPVVDIGRHCDTPYECDFKGHCWAHVPEDSVFDLRGRGKGDKYALYSRGILLMEDIPLDELSGKKRQQVEASLVRRNDVDVERVRAFLETLIFPLYFLDFETVSFAIPRFDGTRPYQAIPFQYSLHRLNEPDGELIHFEYLAEPGTDPRDGLIDRLLENIATEGTVLAYHASFERGVLRSLAEWFPGRAGKIEDVLERVVDLEIPFKNRDVYYYGMKGSSSIKSVLPAMVPHLSYEDMDISNGNMATHAFEAISESSDMFEIARTKKELLEYCKLDTLAMVEIVKKLYELAGGKYLME